MSSTKSRGLSKNRGLIARSHVQSSPTLSSLDAAVAVAIVRRIEARASQTFTACACAVRSRARGAIRSGSSLPDWRRSPRGTPLIASSRRAEMVERVAELQLRAARRRRTAPRGCASITARRCSSAASVCRELIELRAPRQARALDFAISGAATSRRARRVEQRLPRPQARGGVVDVDVLDFGDGLAEVRVVRMACGQGRQQLERALRAASRTRQ